MVKNLAIVIVGLLVIGVLYAVVVPTLSHTTRGRACTEEAMLCPDGSAVGRTGPNCEFAECPQAEPVSGIVGTVRVTALLGPVCPVQRDPPDPQCADRPYEGDFVVTSGPVSKSVRTDASGTFSVDVPAGTYTISSISARAFPHCSTVTAEVRGGVSTEVTISCDTGIR